MHNPGKSCKLIKFSPLASLPEAEAEFLEETFDVVAVNYTDDGLEEALKSLNDFADSVLSDE